MQIVSVKTVFLLLLLLLLFFLAMCTTIAINITIIILLLCWKWEMRIHTRYFMGITKYVSYYYLRATLAVAQNGSLLFHLGAPPLLRAVFCHRS